MKKFFLPIPVFLLAVFFSLTCHAAQPSVPEILSDMEHLDLDQLVEDVLGMEGLYEEKEEEMKVYEDVGLWLSPEKTAVTKIAIPGEILAILPAGNRRFDTDTCSISGNEARIYVKADVDHGNRKISSFILELKANNPDSALYKMMKKDQEALHKSNLQRLKATRDDGSEFLKKSWGGGVNISNTHQVFHRDAHREITIHSGEFAGKVGEVYFSISGTGEPRIVERMADQLAVLAETSLSYAGLVKLKP